MTQTVEPQVESTSEDQTKHQPLGVYTRPKGGNGWRDWVTTVDHKKIGVLYGAAALFFFLIGGIEALLIRLQLATPNGTVLGANSIIAYVDLRGRSAIYFGSEDVIWDQISWVFTHPQIYVFVLPLIGIAYDIVPVAVKVRQKLYNHDLVLIFSSLFGIIGFGAYAQPFFDTPGTPVREEALYVLTAFLAVPLALLLFGGLFETLRMGSKNLTRHPPAPLILSLLSIFLLISGAVVGALRAIEPFELLSTSSNTAQMKLTIGAGLVAIIAAMLWWGGLIVGKTAKQGFGLISGILITAGSLLSGLADSVNGFLGLDDFTTVGFLQEVSAEQIVKILIAFSFIGSVLILGGAVALILVELLRFKNGPVSELDPWEGWGYRNR